MPMVVEWSGSAGVEVALLRGSTIEGVVTDRLGDPLMGVTVRARLLSAPSIPSELRNLDTADDLFATETAEDGSFRFSSLSDGSLYQLEAGGRGWVLLPRRRGDAGSASLVQAPAAEVKLEVDAVRCIRLRFVDETTEQAVPIAPSELELIAYGPEYLIQGVLATDPRVLTGEYLDVLPNWRLTLPAGDPTVIQAMVAVRPTVPVDGYAQIGFSLSEYGTGRCKCRLLVDGDPETTKYVDEVRVRPQPGRALRGTGVLLVTERSDGTHLWRQPWRVLRVWSPGKIAPLSRRGMPQTDGTWIFSSLPIGAVTVALTDGAWTSDRTEVVIQPDDPVSVEVQYTPTGIVLDLRDANDRPLFGADHVTIRGEGIPRGVMTLDPVMTIGEWSPRDATMLRREVDLPPGRYAVSAHKVGYGWVNTITDVVDGTVSDVRLRFGTAHAAPEDPTPPPR
jgi:hypothetical protein